MIRVESYQFQTRGGWVLDAQFMDQMGSPMLLAHGLGKPVEDAKAEIEVAVEGRYRLQVRTRDWVAPQGPGRFKVMVNGKTIDKEFGVGEGVWHWEDGGVVELKEGENEIRLHDLTGFEGRCAAIGFEPCRGGEGEREFISRVEVEKCRTEAMPQTPAREYDLVVVGGGYAGMCAAVAAARKGVKVALVQDRPVWGGNASSEVRVGPIGQLGLPPFPENSDLAYELLELTHVEGKSTSGGLRPIIDNDKLDAWLKAEPDLTTYPCTRCIAAHSTPLHLYTARIESIVCDCWRTGERIELKARQFVDATGDAVLATLAGAEVRTKPEEGESLKGGYGNTNFWTTRWTDHETIFPSCPWALPIDETNWQVNRPKFFVEGDFPYAAGWNWESGFDKDALKDAEAIRDLNFRAAYGMWDYLKNESPDKVKYAKAEMDWMGYVLGKRAAVRIVGDYVLTEKDLVEHREYPDGVVTTTWFLDLHAPHPLNEKAFPGESFRSIAYDDPRYHELMPTSTSHQIRIKPYAIPFRCFYSKNIENLWMAGKDISCTHVAMSSVRVENTTAQMGTMVGRAAVCCLAENLTPRELGKNLPLLQTALRDVKLSPLAKKGRRRYQQRLTIKGEVKHWLRPLVHLVRKVVKR